MIEIENYRIYRTDKRNICIDCYQEVIDKETKEKKYEWIRQGFW